MSVCERPREVEGMYSSGRAGKDSVYVGPERFPAAAEYRPRRAARWPLLVLALVVLLGVGVAVWQMRRPPFLGTWETTGATLALNGDGTYFGSILFVGATGKWTERDGVIRLHDSHSAGGEALRLRWRLSDDRRSLTLEPVGENGGTTFVLTRQ
jgi:hypothetical protein